MLDSSIKSAQLKCLVKYVQDQNAQRKLQEQAFETQKNLDFTSFLAKAFTIVSPGDEYLANWHIDLIGNKLQQVQERNLTRLIINMPPRNLKSISVSVAWPAWLLGHNPTTRIMTSSYSQALSNKHSLDCRLILNSPWYQETFPLVKIAKGENQKSKFVTTQRGFRFSTSTGGTATGEGGDILIVDDPQNPSKINSKKYRETTIEWFEKTFISRLNNKKTGAIVIVMQRLHAEDLCGYLLDKKYSPWEILKLPAIYEQKTIFSCPKQIIPFSASSLTKTKSSTLGYRELLISPVTPLAAAARDDVGNNIILEPGMVLHKEREDIDSLNKIKLELGEYNFAAQYQQEPVPSSGSMIQKSWLKYYSQKDLALLEFSQIIQTWDTAIKAKDESDYSVGITIGINSEAHYILDIYRNKLEFPELITAVQSQVQKWHPQAILIEDQASGQSLIQSLKSNIKIPLIAIKPKFDKVTRFAAHTPLFEAGKIFIASEATWRMALEQELLSFPKSVNDDQVDALSQVLTYLQQRKTAHIRSFK